ncbi:MAG: 16S rRNA (adenine(1518)-N(6)/adenine(1519)-N(6)) -dimethyltransferase RsmA [Chloroflexota bacterium]
MRAQLKSLNRRPNKRLSQSFLEDQGVAASIVRAADIQPGEAVLEVGPGLGALTRRLADTADNVVAVELDPALAQALRTKFALSPHVHIVEMDVLAFAPETHIDGGFVVVANLPYHITSPALRHLLAMGPPRAQRMIVMVQAEVAERIAADPPHMSALAVITQVQTRVKIVRKVPPTAFYPTPAVDSAVMALDILLPEERHIDRDEVVDFTELVHAGFKQPRKTLANSLADGLNVAKSEAIALLSGSGIDANDRPQALTLDEWVRLFRRTRAT